MHYPSESSKKNLYIEHYYRLLGKILVEFNKLEHTILRSIVDFLKPTTAESLIDVQGALSFLSFEDKVQVLRNLVAKHKRKDVGKFKKIFVRLMEIQKKRNDYFHSYWFLDAQDELDSDVMKINPQKLFRFQSTDSGLAHKEVFLSQRDLRIFLKEIRDIRVDLRH